MITDFLNCLQEFGLYCTNDKQLENCLYNIMTNLGSHEYNIPVYCPELSDHEALRFECLKHEKW